MEENYKNVNFSIAIGTNLSAIAGERDIRGTERDQRDIIKARRGAIPHVARSILAGESDSSREFRTRRLLQTSRLNFFMDCKIQLTACTILSSPQGG